MGKRSIKKFLWITSIIWTLIVFSLTILDYYSIHRFTKTIIRDVAISNLNKDTAARHWGSSLGGVYVPIDENTKPNPFLADVPERDIVTPSGKKLTLMNPAYMFRQQMERYYELYGIKGHITSLKHFRPETAPDEWETKALLAFENGVKEVSEYNHLNDKPFYRLMRPLIVEESCLKCHSKQDYKVGDISGGISISVPVYEYHNNANSEILRQGYTSIAFWILGLLLLFISGKKLLVKEEERINAKIDLEKHTDELEKTIKERTSEILISNEELKNEIDKKNRLEKILEKTNKIITNSQAVAFLWQNAPNWPVEYVTENVEKLLGYTVEDFISGKIKYSEIICKKDLGRIIKEVNENSKDKSVTGFILKSYRINTKFGKQIWVEDRSNIIRDFNGEVIYYEGIIIDITERKMIEIENEFKTNFERKIATISTYFVNLQLRDIQKALSFAAHSFGRFLNVERAYAILLNSKKEFEIKSEFLLKDISSLKEKNNSFNISNFSWLHFSLLNRKPILIENAEQLGSAANNEQQLMQSLGIKSFLAIPIVVNGVLYGFLGFDSKENNGVLSKKYLSLFMLLTEVITNLYSRYLVELEKAEIADKNRSLIKAVEQSAASVMITDIKGRIEYVNPKFVEVTGYTFEEVKGANPRIFKSGKTQPAEYENLWKTIKGGKPWIGQFKNINKTGNIFWEQTTISPIKNEKDELTHFLAIKEDITEKILVENQKSLSQKMESIGLLAAGIAHEINTPMQYVGDNVNFLTDSYIATTKVFEDFAAFLDDGKDYTKGEIREFYQKKKEEMDLDFILEEVPDALKQTKIGIGKVTKIVRAMKDFAHPGSKEKAYFNLNKSLENTVTISKNEWKYAATVELKLDENLSEILSLQDELNQVFLNMIVNSAHAISEKIEKHKDNELGNITIETKRDGKTAIIKITDTGCGISKQNLDRIFDPFFTTKEVGKGTGQGLAIVHDIIVNKHGGKIFVESEEGSGTTFIIELPIDGNEDEL